MKIKRTARGVPVGYLPPPNQMGAPAKFDSWREQQEEALILLDTTPSRFSFTQLPTGAGKSLVGYMLARLTGKRTLITTETKGLEDTYWNDFKDHGLVDIRGANNYPCPALEPGGRFAHLRDSKATCDVGPCRVGMYCPLKDAGCPFYDMVRAAQQAKIVVTNSANWLTIGKMKKAAEDTASVVLGNGETLGDFDMLVVDEFHSVDTQVSNALTVEISRPELSSYFGGLLPAYPRTDDFSQWEGWIDSVKVLIRKSLEEVTSEMKLLREGGSVDSRLVKDIRYLKRLGGDIKFLDNVPPSEYGDWIVDLTTFSGRIRFIPAWPAPYCEKYLYRGIKKVVGMSATLNEQVISYTGLKKGEYDYWEFDSSFPVENRPIYFIPTAFMRHSMSDGEKEHWARVIDIIVKMWPRDKGLVHTVSYDRAQYVYDKSQHRERLLCGTRGAAAWAVRKFKESSEPLVLVSPAVSTGYDFKDEDSRFNIIGKVPFPDRRDKIIKLRSKYDKHYPHHLAMMYIVQAAGRIVRSDGDWGTTYILDSVFRDWFQRYKFMAPKWFRDAVKTKSSIPKPEMRDSRCA